MSGLAGKRAWWRQPALHFLVIGAALLAVDRGTGATGVSGPEPVVVTEADLERLRQDHARETGVRPAPAALDARLAQHIDEELLYREALARGLDRGDRSIAYRLIQKMRFLHGDSETEPADLYREALELGLDREDLVVRRILTEKMRLLARMPGATYEPSDAELVSFFERTRERYRQPERVTLHHVFLSAQRRRDSLEADAQALLARLRSGPLAMEEALALGDPFPAGHRFRAQSRQQLAKFFGAEFADAVAALEPGHWSGPVASPYGRHAVWVHAVEPARVPPLDAVRRQVLQRLRAERGDEALAETLRRLRERYAVRVEAGDSGDGA